jgi:hypothetical protein
MYVDKRSIVGRENYYYTSSDVDLLLWSPVGSVSYVICVTFVIWISPEANPICASLTIELESQDCKLTGMEYGWETSFNARSVVLELRLCNA